MNGRRAYVLVHGAWHGGWCWKETARLLRAAGHDVHAPSLSGLGDRSHLPASMVDVRLHIADIAALICWEELDRVILVGHSYGATVTTGVADRMPERIAALVHLDGMVPGVSDPLPPLPSGDSLPAPGAAFFGVSEGARARVDRLMTPHPRGCRDDYVPTGGADTVARRAFVASLGWPLAQRSRDTLGRLAATGGWETHTVAHGHDWMIDDPAGAADYLLTFA